MAASILWKKWRLNRLHFVGAIFYVGCHTHLLPFSYTVNDVNHRLQLLFRRVFLYQQCYFFLLCYYRSCSPLYVFVVYVVNAWLTWLELFQLFQSSTYPKVTFGQKSFCASFDLTAKTFIMTCQGTKGSCDCSIWKKKKKVTESCSIYNFPFWKKREDKQPTHEHSGQILHS